MATKSVKNRKKVPDSDALKSPVSTKSLEPLKMSVTNNLFCLLGNLFGFQASQNADVAPDVYRNDQIRGKGES